MIFKQLFDDESSTYTYVLADEQTTHAVVIDPVLEQVERDLAVLKDLGLKLLYTLETHIHADHVTGAAALRAKTGCQTAVAKSSGSSAYQIYLAEGDKLKVGSIVIEVLETPGHTKTCLSYKVENMVFTGDAVFINSCGRTDFQDGDPNLLYNSVTKKIFTLPPETLIYPCHDYNQKTHSTVAVEKNSNARLSKPREDFVAIMNNLNLAKPKKIDIALPANLRAGKPL